MYNTHRNIGFFKLKRGDRFFSFTLRGRMRWALDNLIRAGEYGCCPRDNPAPRWSAYVHRLRKFGLVIETRMEPHSGAFPGSHAHYVLHDQVERVA